jgi:hypothetical protein
MSKHDDYVTPPYAWENIAQFLPKDICYEPFYGDGKSGEILRGLGLQVIHEDSDFFTNTYDFDYICTNPPFSKLKEIFAKLKDIGKPFVVLSPCSKLTTKYFSKLFAFKLSYPQNEYTSRSWWTVSRSKVGRAAAASTVFTTAGK